MNRWAAWTARLGMLGALVLVLCALPARAPAAIDTEALAARIADSLKNQLTERRYETVAISRIRQEGASANVAELIDFTNVMIVRGRRFKVIDRSRLELILKEQQVQLQDFISTQKYKDLGQLMGVDVFIYGTFYRDALVLKGIDVQNSAIVWADVFPITDHAADAGYLNALGQGMVTSLDKDLDRLKQARIKLVSFWDIDTHNTFAPKAVMDYLSVALTKEGEFKVVDRENIRLIAQEQQLNQEVFIDEQNAKRLGELYGVDAFIYGGITRRPDGTYLASLKMMNIFNGVVEWADLITMRETPLAAAVGAQPAPAGVQAPEGMVYVAPGPFLMGANQGQGIAAPQHRVRLYGFFMDQTEVSNAEYLRFVQAKRYQPPVTWQGRSFPAGQGDLPVVGVSWEGARRYCEFAGKRLPSEAEWEKAARGSNAIAYPWGSDTFSPGFTVTRESGRKAPVPVNETNRDVSPYNVKHMAGNVREWVEDLLQPYPGSSASDARFGRERVVRGGSWATSYESAQTFYRGSSNPSLAWRDLGFRCARSANR